MKMAKKLSVAYGTFVMLGLTIMPMEMRTAQAATKAVPEEVTVSGPYTITRQDVGRMAGTGGWEEKEKLSVSKQVAFSDLDLSKPADVDTLKDRVKKTAREVCRELDRRFPPSIYIPDDDNCVQGATHDGLKRVAELSAQPNQAVASAQ
jgi:UrcA family protein